MTQILPRAVVLLGSWAIGLLVAAWVVPGVSLSLSGFVVAVVVFSVAQAMLLVLIVKLPHAYASLLLGGIGLALTIVALSLASLLTHGLTIRGTCIMGSHNGRGVARDNGWGNFAARVVRTR